MTGGYRQDIGRGWRGRKMDEVEGTGGESESKKEE